MLICPICKNRLSIQNKSYICENSHCFDISKKGYVNLLLSQSSKNKIHGDDKLMSQARREFLNSGHYDKLLKAISDKAQNYHSIIDVGCGEGYYICGIYDNHPDKNSFFAGIDISKDIISYAGARGKNRNVIFSVASCTKLPIESESVDCIISVFAPVCDSEFSRILSKDGIIIRVTPGINHLIELKQAVYSNAQYNETLELSISGFDLTATEKLNYSFNACNQQIHNLFAMTPYYYKTSQSDKEKLNYIDCLKITAEFDLNIYKKSDVY